ncbi:MAG: transglycosylase domain-containing protein [Chloroflexota bacterium]
MKRTTAISRASKRAKKPPPRAPLVIVLSGAFTLFTTFLVLVCVVVAGCIGVYRYYQSVVPDGLQALASFEQQPYQISTVEDRQGYTLQDLVNPKLGVRVIVPLKSVPKDLIDATIDTENRTFWTDLGIDPVRILEAGKHDLTNGSAGIQGASTITQQLVKMAVFGSSIYTPRTLDTSGIQEKIKEWMIAIGATQQIKNCDSRCRKEAILEMYLNAAPYGGTIYGIEAAARYYFDKSVSKLDLAQCALLAGIPQSPTDYNPASHTDYAQTRQHQVLDFMLTQHDITKAQHDAAETEVLHYAFKSLIQNNANNTIESYFVNWLVKDYLSDPKNLAQFGIPDLQQPDDIYRGFIFKTTLDPIAQQTAQNIVTSQVAQLGALNVGDGALVSIDPKNGEIRAYVGGIGYNANIDCPQCDMAWDYRQPGSSFKPFMYVTAFMNGHFPGQSISDSFVKFPDSGSPGGFYEPHNYDLQYHGMVTIRKALANSYNIPAVKTLYSLGPDGIAKVLKVANAMGYRLQTQDPHKLGLSFALGADEGRLIDEVNGYTTFANGGVYRPYMPIMAIYRRNPDNSKTLLWKYKAPKGVQVIPAQDAYLITNILADTAAKVPAFGDAAYSLLGLPYRQLASKTGTTNDFKDNLTMGYTPNLVTGVWVGNPNDTAMQGTTGITGAAPIWHAYMSTMLQNMPVENFIQPPGIITATVSVYSPPGGLPGLATGGNGVTDIFAAGSVPRTFDQPSQDDYSAQPAQPGATPAASTTPGKATTTNPSGCSGSYTYTTTIVKGKTVYHYVCTG